MPKNLIIKDNSLINASYNLDLIEQRIILLAVAQSRKKGVALSADRKVIINVSDYIDIYNISGRSVYENIKSACATLFERQFTYMEKQGQGVRVAKSRWVSEVAYNDKTSTIDVTFAPAIIPLINMLESHFTSYELEKVANLNSKYSVRLYEVLISWRSTGKTPMLPLDEVRYRLGVAENEYKLIEPFKRRVLDLAIREISKKTDIQVSYEQHKQGRKIIGFTFTFKVKGSAKEKAKNAAKETADLLADTTAQVEPFQVNPIFQNIAAYVPIADQQAYLERYSAEQIAAIIERADEYAADLRLKGKKPRMGAVYKKAFDENWGAAKVFEQQELKKKQEAKRLAQQKEQEEQRLAEQQRLEDDEKKRQAIEIFEMMDDEEREAVLDEIERRLAPFFKEKFRKNRASGQPVYRDTLVAITLRKIIFDS